MIRPDDLPALLESRKDDFKVIDQWDAARPKYSEWHAQIRDIQHVYAGDWDMVWPDKVRTRALPKVPNLIQIAADDRARQVSSVRPNILCPPPRAGSKAEEAAEKRERIIGAWWEMCHVLNNVQDWAHDAMGGGLTVCRVLPDFGPRNRRYAADERFPMYERLNPATSWPDPTFARGPFLDSFIYSTEEHVRTVRERFSLPGQPFGFSKEMQDVLRDRDRIRVIEYYDTKRCVIVLEAREEHGGYGGGKRAIQTVVDQEHYLDVCPVVIGSRSTMDGTYRGEFFGSLGVLNMWNRMMTLTLDDAMQKVYAPKQYFDVENPEEYGPDALLELQSPQGKFEFIQPPNTPFTNLQILHDLAGFARAGVLLPPSRSGDPNESIISAAGVTSTQSQFIGDVKSIQTDILAVMLSAANEVAMKVDETWADVPKVIYGTNRTGSSYRETYTPSKDINGDYRNTVSYGNLAGLDPINANVMVLQDWAGGQGLISRKMAMEQSPIVDDPQRAEKELLQESMQSAMIAGLQQQAAQGTITAQQLAEIDKALSDDAVSLSEAIASVSVAAPLAQPQLAAPGAQPQAPGLAGAATGGAGGSEALAQAQSVLPSLRDLGVRR